MTKTPRRMIPQTPAQMRRYIDMAARRDEPCKYGHFGCAAWDGGPCSAELATAIAKATGEQLS